MKTRALMAVAVAVLFLSACDEPGIVGPDAELAVASLDEPTLDLQVAGNSGCSSQGFELSPPAPFDVALNTPADGSEFTLANIGSSTVTVNAEFKNCYNSPGYTWRYGVTAQKVGESHVKTIFNRYRPSLWQTYENATFQWKPTSPGTYHVRTFYVMYQGHQPVRTEPVITNTVVINDGSNTNFTASINGPSMLSHGQHGAFSAHTSGAYSPTTYEWRYRTDNNSWSGVVNTSGWYGRTMPHGAYRLELQVKVTKNGVSKTVRKSVSAY